MTPLIEAARAAHAAGLRVLPPREDGSKAPLGNWKAAMAKMPSEAQLKAWYGPKKGIGVVTGAISGNLEAIDFDSAGECYEPLKTMARERGLGALVERLEAGYLEQGPGGGFHWLYRCSEIGENKKLARRDKLEHEKRHPKDLVQCLIETRGEGGFLVVAPSGGEIHPTGKPYVLLAGGWATIPTITPEERKSLHDVARQFNTYRDQPERSRPADARASTNGNGNGHEADRPGDRFNRERTWAQILEPHGWKLVEQQGEESHWRRPGKDQGTSATTNYMGADTLKVFTTSSPFDGEATYTKFGAFAVLEHGGDHAEAARAFRATYAPPPAKAAPVGPTAKKDAHKKPVVKMRPELQDVVREAEAALVAAGVPIYVRAGELVRLIRDSRGVLIRPLPKCYLLVLMAQHIRFVAPKQNKEGTWNDVGILPPRAVVDGLHEAGSWKFPELESVVVAPTMRPDGTVLDAVGYDAATHLIYEPNEAFPAIPENPTRSDAQAALRVVDEPFAEFPFTDRSDRSAAWALLCSVLGRGGYGGATPIFVVRTPTPGTGKNLLTQVVGILSLRRDPPAFAAPEKPEEWYKKLGQHVIAGHRFTVIDECLRLDSRDLASAVTQEFYQDRLMGGMDEFYGRLPVYASCGNNTIIAGDFGRRVVPIEVDSGQERPEGRSFTIEDLPGWCYQNRARVVAAVLTVLRAYVVAGRPAQSLLPMGSFERWSRFIRSALVWAGAPDPVAGQARVRADADSATDDASSILTLWHASPILDRELTARELCETLQPKDHQHPLPELRDLLLSMVRDPKQRDTLRSTVLGYVLKAMRNRPMGRLVLRARKQDDKGHTLAWWVESAQPDARMKDASSAASSADHPPRKHHSHIDLMTLADEADDKTLHGETFGDVPQSVHRDGGVGDARILAGNPVSSSASSAESQSHEGIEDAKRMKRRMNGGRRDDHPPDDPSDAWEDGRE